MKLQILLNASVPAWLQILDQEKISYAIFEAMNFLPSGDERYPVLILAKNDSQARALALSHLKQGGSVIADLDTRSKIRGLYYPGKVFLLDVSIRDINENWATQRKDFSFNGVVVSEIMAVKKKAEARKLVRDAVQKAFWSQGLPYVHLWYYPRGYRSVFSFRFDLDEYNAEGHEIFCRLLEKYRGSVSCFACLRTFEPFASALAKVVRSGVEVGYHGYIHHVYQDYAQNMLNFEYAERLLQKYPGTVKSFTAPHGTWHPSLQRLLEERGYIYSSEFGLDYDNFPFFPINRGKVSSVLQVPTHPVCEGAFWVKSLFQEPMLGRYFDAVIDYKIKREEPALFFGHPDHRLGKHPEIFTNIVRSISRYPGVWKTEFRQWALWWKKRHCISFIPMIEDRTLKIAGLENSADCVTEIIFPDGRREIDTHGGWAAADRVESASPVVEAVAFQSFFQQLKLGLKSWLDWETKTPLRLLKITGVRTFAKRMIRSLVMFLKPKETRA